MSENLSKVDITCEEDVTSLESIGLNFRPIVDVERLEDYMFNIFPRNITSRYNTSLHYTLGAVETDVLDSSVSTLAVRLGIVYLVDENFNNDVYFDISIYMYGANNLWTITVCKTDDTPLKTIEVDQSTPLNNAFTELVDPLVDYLKEIPLQLS